jgi:phytoene desaturase (3,4-didehydrolycopene-forming)
VPPIFTIDFPGLAVFFPAGVFSLLAATEITDGVFYPVGGFSKVAEGLQDICQQHGVRVMTSAAVSGIRSKGDVVTGVELQDGIFLEADTVVTNR